MKIVVLLRFLFREVRGGAHVLNFDNYAHTIAAYVPSIDDGAFHNCSWAGVTLRKLDGVDLSLRRPQSNLPQQTLAAMPDSLYADSLFSALGNELASVDSESSNYLKGSLVYRYKVNSYPPKPSLADIVDGDLPEEEFEELAEVLSGEALDGMAEVYPADILDHSVGSNDGLMDLVLKFMKGKHTGPAPCTDYSVWLTDINIYHRINKVLARA